MRFAVIDNEGYTVVEMETARDVEQALVKAILAGESLTFLRPKRRAAVAEAASDAIASALRELGLRTLRT